MEIQPNKWYRLVNVYGIDALEMINASRIARREGIANAALLADAGISSASEAYFRGGHLAMNFGHGIFSSDSFDSDGENRIHYPLKKAGITDIDGGGESEGKSFFASSKYGSLKFILDPVAQEDLRGHAVFVTEGEAHGLEQDYAFRMLLRAGNQAYVSEERATFPFLDEFDMPAVVFGKWRPSDSNETGVIYVPMESRELSRLEIMLEEKI